MDILINLYVKNKFNELRNYIEFENEITDDDYSNFFYYFVFLCSNDKLKDMEFFKLCYLIFSFKLKIEKVMDINKKLYILKNKNCFLCYNYLYVLYNLSKQEQYMESLLKKMNHNTFLKKRKLIIKSDIYYYFRKTFTFIKSFDDNLFQILKHKKKYDKQWEEINSIELKIRFDAIKKFFGSKYLIEIGIISKEEGEKDFLLLDFDKKIIYFFNLMNKIEVHLNNIIKNYEMILNELNELENIYKKLMQKQDKKVFFK